MKTQVELSKEKAEELFRMFYGLTETKGCAVNCAIYLANEVIDVIEYMAESEEPNKLPFWYGVKFELMNMEE